jgi:hypothetical protein
MSTERSPQSMKPSTAAQKLGIYLPAAPEEFQNNDITRAELNELLANPPEWIVQLRLTGLARGGVDEALTTAQIQELLAAPPRWLVTERRTQADVREENARLKQRDKERVEWAAKQERIAEREASDAANRAARAEREGK